PPDKVVVEIQENVPADESVIAACLRLKQRSYRIALDNFVPSDAREALVPRADFIKVDIRRLAPGQGAALAARHASEHCRMLAQRVETRQQFVTALKDGFTLFQGYFFRHPERMRARRIPTRQATCGCCRRFLRRKWIWPRWKISSNTTHPCATACCAT